MRRSVLGWFVAVLALLTTACPPRLALSLYNNTGANLVVLVGDRRIEWKGGTTLRISDQLDIKWDELEWKDDPRLRIRAPELVVETSNGAKRYWLKLPGLPDEYSDFRIRSRGALPSAPAGRKSLRGEGGRQLSVAPLPPQIPGLPIEPARL